MTAQTWLQETPWPTQQLPRQELEERIEHLLATHWMAVLSTIGKNGPIGSPVEYFAEGLSTYMLPQPGSPKLKAMERDPRICVTVHANNCGWASVRGAQIFATARLVEPGTPEHNHVMSVYRWQQSAVQTGSPLDQPPQVPMLIADPERIVYTEHWLRKSGFGPRQIWHKDPERAAKPVTYAHE